MPAASSSPPTCERPLRRMPVAEARAELPEICGEGFGAVDVFTKKSDVKAAHARRT